MSSIHESHYFSTEMILKYSKVATIIVFASCVIGGIILVRETDIPFLSDDDFSIFTLILYLLGACLVTFFIPSIVSHLISDSFKENRNKKFLGFQVKLYLIRLFGWIIGLLPILFCLLVLWYAIFFDTDAAQRIKESLQGKEVAIDKEKSEKFLHVLQLIFVATVSIAFILFFILKNHMVNEVATYKRNV